MTFAVIVGWWALLLAMVLIALAVLLMIRILERL